MGTIVELRCPNSPRGLLARMKRDGERPTYLDGMLIEFACRDCARAMRRDGEVDVRRVYHRFNVLGELVESEVMRLGDDLADDAAQVPIHETGVVAASTGRPTASSDLTEGVK